MLQLVLTGLAGIVLGIVAMRVWQSRESTPSVDASANDAAPQTEGAAEKPPTETAGFSLQSLSSRQILMGAGGLVVVAAAVFALRPADNGSSSAALGGGAPVAGGTDANGKALDDVDTMTLRLAARLEKEPDNGEGFRMLGWSYVMTGHPDKAITAYERAVKLLPAQANVHAGYGEALVGAATGTVTPEAKAAFDKAIAIDRSEPRARYFEALWQAQHGQQKQALDSWIDLANGASPDAPWLGDVRRQIGDTAGKLGIDVSSRLKAAAPAAAAVAPGVAAGINAAPPPIPQEAMKAAGALPASDRQAMIDQMVEGLANKLKANPKDVEGWAKLLRSRMVLKQTQQAGQDLGIARRALASSPDDLAKVNAVARELSVPGA